jgi:methyl-accepting chemotaxis protein
MTSQMENLAKETVRFEQYRNDQQVSVQQTEYAFTNIIENVSKINERISNVKGAINRVEAANEDLSEKLFEVSAISEESVATSEQVSASSVHQKEAIHQVNLAATELQEIALSLQTEVDQFNLGESVVFEQEENHHEFITEEFHEAAATIEEDDFMENEEDQNADEHFEETADNFHFEEQHEEDVFQEQVERETDEDIEKNK